MRMQLTPSALSVALISIMKARGVADAEDAVDIISVPLAGDPVYMLLPAQRARGVLAEEFTRIMGRTVSRNSPVWTLEEPDLRLILHAGASRAAALP
jgi:hypothetical protein